MEENEWKERQKDLNIEDIKTFLYVANEMNFSRAAEILYISQSAVTARIKSLESELGCSLFERSNTFVRLTVHGQHFLKYAENIVNLENESKHFLLLTEKYDSYLTIGAPDSVWQYPLFPFLSTMHERFPRTAFKLICEHSLSIINSIQDSAADIGIIVEPPKNHLLAARKLWSNRYLLVSSPDLPIPFPCFTPENAGQFPFINMSWSHSFSEWLELTYHTRIYPYQTDRIFLFLNMLQNGLGVGFLPYRIACSFLSAGLLREIPYTYSETAPVETGLLVYPKKYEKTLSPYINELMKFSFS